MKNFISNKKINKQAKQIAKIIAEKYKPKKIILFGSVARGDTHEWSDIDLCIIKNTKLPQRKRIWNIYKLINDFKCDYGIEPVVFTQKEFQEKQDKYFIRNIIKDGKILYGS